ncbi:MAG: SprB repeat-containing protein [Cyclobacteriaceae bacterium]
MMRINLRTINVTEMKKEFLILIGMVLFAAVLHGCKEDVEPPLDCTQLTLTVANKSDVSQCGEIDGSIQVSASGGVEPYSFDLNGLTNTTGLFTGLKAGLYTVTVTGGNRDCSADTEVKIMTSGSDLDATATAAGSSVCPPASNGSIAITASGGVPPYEYKFGINPFSANNVRADFGKGIYTVEVKDSENCQVSIAVEVPGMAYGTIKSLIELNCATANCHDGSLGAQSDYTLFENVKENSNAIRTLTGNKSMPPNSSLSQEQIDLIACWVADGANL